MTGKPLPFISYGGSSIIVSLMLAGLILRVSHESARRDEYDRRRDSFAVMDESTAGVPHTRGERSSRGGFTVLNGFASESDARSRPAPQSRPQRPTPRNTGGGYNRIDLNSDPSARLRTETRGRAYEGTTMTDKMTVAIAAGGTAGHINPALALAEELRDRGHHVVFVVSRISSRVVWFPRQGSILCRLRLRASTALALGRH